jgi:hypothetical protein
MEEVERKRKVEEGGGYMNCILVEHEIEELCERFHLGNLRCIFGVMRGVGNDHVALALCRRFARPFDA